MEILKGVCFLHLVSGGAGVVSGGATLRADVRGRTMWDGELRLDEGELGGEYRLHGVYRP